MAPFKTLDLPRALLPDLQRSKDTDRCAALGAQRSQDSVKTADANLDCEFVEKAPITLILDFEGSTK